MIGFASLIVAYLGGSLRVLTPAQIGLPAHHLRHRELFGEGVPAYNQAILAGADRVQATAMDGGGYFIGVKANPPESPLGYPLSLGNSLMLAPARPTSYCSGSSYGAFIEALNEILGSRLSDLSPDRSEAFRMQEPDGGRREDGVKVWGWWNADGWGCDYALVQYLAIGEKVDPKDAIPGDFMNISWKSGLGHSVVFLGWGTDGQGRQGIRYWSSQTGTNGFGDQFSPLSKVESVVTVRLTHPEKLFDFIPPAEIDKKIPGDPVGW